ncbi:Endonuclease domain-containing 1 protein, partial [Acanthisitta chloris]
WLGHSEVVRSLATSCPQFFYKGMVPKTGLEPPNPAEICQHYNNQYQFATLYDTARRIPVYSAYIYEPGAAKRSQGWLIEPQLVNPKYSKSMETENNLLNREDINIQDIGSSQATTQDYVGLKGLTRGHMNPSGHHSNFTSKKATFTLTNIVPQNDKLNSGAWSRYEVSTMAKKSKGCTTTYVITGAVPGNTNIANGRVNTPSHIWSSACCVTKSKLVAWAGIAENNKDKVQQISLGDLEKMLSNLYTRGRVSLFHSDCPRQ